MSESEVPDLVGKVIAVKYGSAENRDYAYIEVVGFEVQAGRRFLVGKTASTSYNDAEGIRFCVAWDIVTAYYEFDTLEACHDAIASWYPTKKKSRFWFY